LSPNDLATGRGTVTDVILPGTTVIGDDRVVGARLRPLGGHDEVFVVEQAGRSGGMATANALLRRCVSELRFASGRTPPASDLVGSLTAGDREALLLRLRQVSFGDRLGLVLTCPEADCGEAMDLELTVSDLVCTPAELAPAIHEVRETTDGPPLRFRLPTWSDLEAIAPIARGQPERAATALARLCLVEGPPATDQVLVDLLDPRIAELDPQAEIELSVTCPACGAAFTSGLDAGDLLCAEMVARQGDLDLAVHLLALHYHWSEDEILALPVARRRRYVEALVDGLVAREGLGQG